MNRYTAQGVKYMIFTLLLAYSGDALFAQDSTSRKTSFLIFPSLSYQPETGYQFGLHNMLFFDLDKNNLLSRRSKVDARFFYTTKGQYFTSDYWQLFTKDEKYNISGQVQAGYWIDRYYGVGTPGREITEYNKGVASTANYFDFAYRYFDFYTLIDRKIAPHIFAGLMAEYDHSGSNRILADSLSMDPAAELQRNDATRAGLGVNLNYDSRDNYDNPSQGAYVQLIGGAYRKAFGGSTDYHILTINAVRYIPVIKKQVLALRIVVENRESDGADPIPLRGLSYNGGISSLRGYYVGTFRDNNLLAFESEYRLPIYINDKAPIWKFWERIGVVGFFSGVRTSDQIGQLFSASPGDYHFAAGAGLRYMIDTKQRINLTMDYAVGFDRTDGNGKRPSGLYFSLGEAF